MTIRISIQNWDELWNESIDNGSIVKHLDDGDRIFQGFVGDSYQVYSRRVRLPNGLRIAINNYKPSETLIINSQVEFNSFIVLSFFATFMQNALEPPETNFEIAQTPLPVRVYLSSKPF